MKLNQSLNKSESRSSVSHQVYLNHSDTFKVAWFSTCKWSVCQQSNEQGIWVIFLQYLMNIMF